MDWDWGMGVGGNILLCMLRSDLWSCCFGAFFCLSYAPDGNGFFAFRTLVAFFAKWCRNRIVYTEFDF